MKNGMVADDGEYQAKDDMRTLKRAEEIRGDKKRMGRAMKMAQSEMNETMAMMKKEKGLRS